MQKGYIPTLKQNEVDKFKYKCSRIFLFLCIINFVIGIYSRLTYNVAPVNGYSMYPTLNSSNLYNYTSHQDYVVLNYIKSYHKGDIIVAKKENGSTEDYIYVIKRLIAIEGDTVEILSNGSIRVNDAIINEEYVKSNNKPATFRDFNNYKNTNPIIDGKSIFEDNVLTVPKGYVFYLGDNRGNSYDCSSYGPVKKEMIIAKVDYIFKDGENRFISLLKQIFN